MAMIEHAPEWTDQAEYETHLHNYQRFVRLLWWNVAAIVVVLIFLAAWAG
jgi:hypothetical protein